MSDEVEAIARRGLFEGALTTREIQELCGAVLAEISTRRAEEMFAKARRGQ